MNLLAATVFRISSLMYIWKSEDIGYLDFHHACSGYRESAISYDNLARLWGGFVGFMEHDRYRLKINSESGVAIS